MNQDHPPAEKSQADPAESSSDEPGQGGLLRWWKWYLMLAALGVGLGIFGLPSELPDFSGLFETPPEPVAPSIVMPPERLVPTPFPTPIPTLVRMQSSTSTETPTPRQPAIAGEMLVLLASFQDPAAGSLRDSRDMSRDLAEQIPITLVDYPNIDIEHVNYAIDPQNGSDQARALAQDPRINASMVIWGHPADWPDSDLRIHIELIDADPGGSENDGSAEPGATAIQPDRLEFDVDLEQNLDYLVSFVSAVILFNAGEYADAVPLFDTTAKETSVMQQAMDFHRALHFYRGANYIHLGLVQDALPELEALLPLEHPQVAGDETFAYAIITNLGMVYAYFGEVEQALDQHTQALRIAQELGDQWREAIALGNLGLAYRSLGQAEEAIDSYQQAVAIDRALGDRRSEAVDLGDLGLAYADVGRTDEAIDHYRQSMLIAQEIGDRRVEGNGLANLANVHAASGRLDEAIDHYQRALVISQEIGNPWGEGVILANLGIVYADLGQVDQAVEHYRQALEILEEIGAPNADVVRQLLAELSP